MTSKPRMKTYHGLKVDSVRSKSLFQEASRDLQKPLLLKEARREFKKKHPILTLQFR